MNPQTLLKLAHEFEQCALVRARHRDDSARCAFDACAERLREVVAADGGTRDVPISVLTWQPGGARGNNPVFDHSEILVAVRSGDGWILRREEATTIGIDVIVSGRWPWSCIDWYSHLEGVTLPGPAAETEDDAE